MYAFQKCQCPECTKPAITLYDDDGKIMDAPNWCYEHSPDKDFVRENIRKYLQSHDRIIGMNAEGLKIENWNISGKRFYGCNFQHCTFANLHGDNIRLRMCMLDFSVFTDCSFLHGNTQFCSFAGSKFVHALFTNSDMIHNNFNGITAYQCSFDDSDLYNSRFIKAMLINTSMNNCNLKKTVFYESMREGVGFKLSNTRESLLDRNKGGLMGDFGIQYQDMDDVLMPRNEDDQKEVFL
jgi:uncharacterized protein YjbI with pentapeptide repeats